MQGAETIVIEVDNYITLPNKIYNLLDLFFYSGISLEVTPIGMECSFNFTIYEKTYITYIYSSIEDDYIKTVELRNYTDFNNFIGDVLFYLINNNEANNMAYKSYKGDKNA
jgi:hypothetical protein